MLSRQKKEITKGISIFLKILCVIISLFSISYFFFNVISLNRLERSVVEDYKDIYSITRRFSSYYNNTDSTFLEKGNYDRNNVSIIVNRDSQVKVLSPGIRKLRIELEKLVGNNVWTVAVFQNPSNYMHFDPLRKQYEMFFKGLNHENVIEDIVDKKSLNATYQSFYGCNLKLTEKYIEQQTNQEVRSIYYSIYNNKHLDSLLVIDLKASLFSDMVTQFNDKYNTVINSHDVGSSYKKSLFLPCSEEEKITLGIKLVDIVKVVLFPSLLFSFTLYFLILNFNRRKYLLQFDRMTGFYRRDYYEKRLQKMKSHSLLLIDIDHFKRINDTYGHKKGDDVIQEVADRILNNIQVKDIAIRWGGEEFIIVFDSLSQKGLEKKAENIRCAIEKEKIKGIPVTISLGGVIANDVSFTDAYKRADAALYVSKESGRNKVTIDE
jgi:diguanylate cyclase (GGDEF)-like protein